MATVHPARFSSPSDLAGFPRWFSSTLRIPAIIVFSTVSPILFSSFCTDHPSIFLPVLHFIPSERQSLFFPEKNSMMEDHDLPHHCEVEVLEVSNEAKAKVPLKKRSSSCNRVCGFSKHTKHKLESENRLKSAKKLGGLMVLCLIFIGVEIVGGLKANSLAVITDAFHLLTDVIGFSVSLFTVWATSWDATPRHSFGFLRLDALGALFSIQLIWLISGMLIYEAIVRILTRSEVVDGKLMFATATFGVVINIVMVMWLGHDHVHHACSSKGHHHHGAEESDGVIQEEMSSLIGGHHNHEHEHHNCDIENHQHQHPNPIVKWMQNLKQTHANMNLQGAYLHVLGDLIQSVGVMIGGAVIWAKPNWLIVDLICTLGFSVLVLFTTVSMIKSILAVLMESTPSEIDVGEVETGLNCLEGVLAVHDLHVWAMSVGKLLLSCHITVAQGVNTNEILLKTRHYCEKIHGIQHSTIQTEQEE